MWGATEHEAVAQYGCDRFGEDGSVRAVRAVTVHAPPDVVFGWVCQIQRAPYSFDLIDNFGRRSPRTADPSLTRPQVGDRFMTLFRLEEVVPDRSLTLKAVARRAVRWFGPVAMTYEVVPTGGGARLIGVLAVPLVGRLLPRTRRLLLTWGDLVMMRRQLTLLARLSERDARAAGR